MENKPKKGFVVYFSPAGTTRHVAEVIKSMLDDTGCSTEIFDLGRKEDFQRLEIAQESFSAGDSLWIGSPVYTYHALPPVTEFIAGLPRDRGVFAVPFVTWGAVSSGLALPEWGDSWKRKDIVLRGLQK